MEDNKLSNKEASRHVVYSIRLLCVILFIFCFVEIMQARNPKGLEFLLGASLISFVLTYFKYFK
ncbi:MAG: hypothetical protein ACI8ZM_005322 [Crocinitomix sp.]|jgi:hypothetical protein